MAVMAREAWTDERMDDLKENVNQRFDDVDKVLEKIDKRFDRVEGEMKAGFQRVDDKFDALQADMKHGFESMYRTMVIGFVTLFASIVASVLGAALLS